MAVEMRTTRLFEETLRAITSAKPGQKVRLLHEGGTSSSKTYTILQALIILAERAVDPLLISIVSETMPQLRKGAMKDFFDILNESPDSNPYFNRTQSEYHRPTWMGRFEFFGADEADKTRGPRRNILFINEGNRVQWEAARNLDVRTDRLTIVDWNPTGEFWAHEYWINEPETPYLVNRYIHSTYQDALAVLSPAVVAGIEAYKDTDPNWWNIYGLGRLGKVEGLVYPYFEQVDELPKGDRVYGLDFGFTGDPAALVCNVIIGSNLYSKELIYETGLTNDVLARRMDLLGIRKNYDEIFADAAEPKSIEEIAQKVFNIKPCEKGQGSVEYGVQKVNQFKQFWTKDSLNGIREQRNFRYIADKNGKLTEKTTHQWSHLMDARRYAMATHIESVTTTYKAHYLRSR